MMTKVSALGVEKSLKEAGVEMKEGTGILAGPREVRWQSSEGEMHLKASNICIAWGSEPAVLPGMHTSDRIMTSDGFLELQMLPEKVIIVGGSVIGVEFATFLAELGVQVTIVEILETLLPLEEEEVSGLLKQELTRRGIVIHTAGSGPGADGIGRFRAGPGGKDERFP